MTRADLQSPTDLEAGANRDIPAALRALLADVFALYLKTKNFHWHMSGPHFRDYHLLLDEQSDQIFAMTDDIAERARKIAARRCVRSDMSRASSASSTTTPNTSIRRTCWRNCAATTSS
jgi:DNA-binding ferritin-like protein